NDEILSHVWDKNKLASSSQRLWQVMKELKRKLSLLGITDNLITRVDNSGYYIDFRIVKKLYCNVLPGD
ncbi:CadC family transcriptional regulator, partial [Buttiauxella sp. B2]